MGGFESVNFREDKKTTVEDALCLDLLPLVWLRAVQAGTRRTGTICWPASARREHAATIEYAVDMTGTPWMRLKYFYGSLEENEPVEYPVRLVTTPQHYGGGKWWFACPLMWPGGKACAKRVRQLYLPPGRKYFGCRHCYALTYASRQDRLATSVREWPAITIERSDLSEERVLRAGR